MIKNFRQAEIACLSRSELFKCVYNVYRDIFVFTVIPILSLFKLHNLHRKNYYYKWKTWKGDMIKNVKKKGRV